MTTVKNFIDLMRLCYHVVTMLVTGTLRSIDNPEVCASINRHLRKSVSIAAKLYEMSEEDFYDVINTYC